MKKISCATLFSDMSSLRKERKAENLRCSQTPLAFWLSTDVVCLADLRFLKYRVADSQGEPLIWSVCQLPWCKHSHHS